jgi:glucose/arabinose dehydrogenase
VQPSSKSLVLWVDQPASNHNGGMIEFGPDGYLYVALGDGGGGGDPFENAENPETVLGSLLRISVDEGDAFPTDPLRNFAIPAGNPFVDGGGAAEVWAYGLRNPWRFSFDGAELYIGDVGQGNWEEVDVASTESGGLNYGWDHLEGSHCYEPAVGCDSAGTVLPVLEYSHSEGCSITGGYVYRGSKLAWLNGHYFYSDYCSGWIRSFEYTGGDVTNATDWTSEIGTLGNVSSFGEDSDGELYIVTLDGNIYQLVAATP